MLLIACPSCSRQYDVTGLAPGSQVRCHCEELFLVRWPSKLSAKALTCTHCGGAVGVEDDACPYCLARISEQDRRQTTLCPSCFVRLEDGSKHCNACGLEIRPQALTPLPADRDCPRCKGALRVRSIDVTDVIECSECLGIWLTPQIFERATIEAERPGSGTELLLKEVEDAPPRKWEAVSYIPCIACGELMQRRQYVYQSRGSGTVIDMCRGHGVWLDHKELESILDFVRTGGALVKPHKLPDPAAFIISERRGRPTRIVRSSEDVVTSILESFANSIFRLW